MKTKLQSLVIEPDRQIDVAFYNVGTKERFYRSKKIAKGSASVKELESNCTQCPY